MTSNKIQCFFDPFYTVVTKNLKSVTSFIDEPFVLLFQSERKLFLGGREVTLAQQYMAVAVCSIPLFLLAGAGENRHMTSK